MELQRQMGFGSGGTAWAWLRKVRRAMVVPGRKPLGGRIEAEQTLIGGPQTSRPGRGAAGKTVIAGAVEAGRGKGRGRRLGQLRLQTVPMPRPTASKASSPATWHGPPRWARTAGKAMPGSTRPVMTTSRSISARCLQRCRAPIPRRPSRLRPRRALTARHPSRCGRHRTPPGLPRRYVFRFNRAPPGISRRFARLVEQAVHTKPTTYRSIVATPAST